MKNLLLCLVLLTLPCFGETQMRKDKRSIIGGQSTQTRNFPFVLKMWINGVGQCSASLIAPQWALTAGHCVTDDNGMVVATSRISIDSYYPDRVSISKIGRVIVHPNYQTAPVNRVDLALVEILEIPGGRLLNVEPVKIANKSQEMDAYLSNTLATAIGWGSIEKDRFPEIPYKAEIPWWTNQDCIKERFIVVPDVVHSETLCAGYETKGPTPGDSGSPLLIPTSQGSWTQIGVASTHTIGRRGGGIDRVPVYMRLTAFREWIYSHVGEVESQPLSMVFPHVFAGPFGNTEARTEIVITNLHPENDCAVSLEFSRGTEMSPFSVSFNGRQAPDNTIIATIPATGNPLPGAVRRFVMTAPDAGALAVGALYVTPEARCSGLLSVQGRYLLNRQSDGEIVEVFSIVGQDADDWMEPIGGEGASCRVLSGVFGQGRDVGLAWVTATPGEAAPEGASLEVWTYDWDAEPVDPTYSSLQITGEQTALNPWDFNEPRLITFCLSVPGDSPRFRLALIAIGAKATSQSVQYATESLIKMAY